MANRERGEVEVKAGEKAYTLRPTFNAICALEELVGMTLDDLYAQIGAGRMSGLRSCVWCLLQPCHADEIKTLEDAGNWIERVGTYEIMAALAKVQELNNETQTTKGRASGNPRKARVGTGARSSSVRAAVA